MLPVGKLVVRLVLAIGTTLGSLLGYAVEKGTFFI